MSVVEKSIIQSIEKNGFPKKAVSLPFKPIFDSCKKHDLKLADVLRALQTQDIHSNIGDEKIVFYRHAPTSVQDKGDDPSTNRLFDVPPEFMKTAMEQLKNMTPEQLKELKEKAKLFSPQENSRMMDRAKELFGEHKDKA